MMMVVPTKKAKTTEAKRIDYLPSGKYFKFLGWQTLPDVQFELSILGMKKHRLAFFDLETTGLDPARHEIIEMGLVLTDANHKVLDEWEVKVKPLHLERAEPEALRINRYNPADWLFALDLKPALEVLMEKAADATLITHNITFDWSFLQAGLATAGVKNRLHFHRLDLMSIAYAKLYKEPRVERFSLAALADFFKITNERAHTALADTQTAYQLFLRLMQLP
jgi:DNA polymerase III epsilon subunit-like protein